MSYDFDLFRVPSGVDPATEYDKRREGASDWTGNNPGPLESDKEQLKRRLADALMSRHPTFREFKWDYKELARKKSIDEDEARRRYRHLELTDDSGFQITLFDDTAAVTIAFWPNAANVLRSAWDCLKLLESIGNFSTYDPQIGKVLDLDSDFHPVLQGLTQMTERVSRALRKPKG